MMILRAVAQSFKISGNLSFHILYSVLKVDKDMSKKTDEWIDGCVNGWVNGAMGGVTKY
jgi:hypothetical protein